MVVGDGPARAELEERYPDVHFTGVKFGEELANAYAQADVFVFPSLTDTFGNTILEALASGVPVAAYPVTGPLDIIGEESLVGALDENLQAACIAALSSSREKARELALQYSWKRQRCNSSTISAPPTASSRRNGRRRGNMPPNPFQEAESPAIPPGLSLQLIDPYL